MSFTVAIVGRPNVGKSTLFNRLVGKKLALVDDTPGVTRDRRPGEAKLVDLRFRVVDTAGLEEAAPETLQGRMRAQTEAAIDEADLSLFVVDAKFGLTPVDQALAEMLSRVMPASGPVRSRSSPRTRLISVDLPALGRPMIATRSGLVSS